MSRDAGSIPAASTFGLGAVRRPFVFLGVRKRFNRGVLGQRVVGDLPAIRKPFTEMLPERSGMLDRDFYFPGDELS